MKVYEKVYEYFLSQMREGKLMAGDRMPSLRQCVETLLVSKTSAEAAYMQLADDGYIYSIEKKGYYVTRLAQKEMPQNRRHAESTAAKTTHPEEVIYDLATIGEDKSVSCLDLWRRYMKSALRQEDRLLSYAAVQGEEDLRLAIAEYVRKTRNIICVADDIVIGSGFQSLLSILIPLIGGEKTVSIPTIDYADGAAVFAGAGYQVSYRNKACHVIYVIPSYMTKWGEVMTIKRRHELIGHALQDDHLIIEDDYQNEFVFSGRPNPSLYAMTGGENVAFLGSFSRILLPSVRISYLILPKGYGNAYRQIKNNYNQTASKAEQIALTQFLRDGHLHRHVKKMRHLYEEKRRVMEGCLRKSLTGSESRILLGDSGMEIGLRLPVRQADAILARRDLSLILLNRDEERATFLLSCSRIRKEDIDPAIRELAVCQKNVERCCP